MEVFHYSNTLMESERILVNIGARKKKMLLISLFSFIFFLLVCIGSAAIEREEMAKTVFQQTCSYELSTNKIPPNPSILCLEKNKFLLCWNEIDDTSGKRLIKSLKSELKSSGLMFNNPSGLEDISVKKPVIGVINSREVIFGVSALDYKSDKIFIATNREDKSNISWITVENAQDIDSPMLMNSSDDSIWLLWCGRKGDSLLYEIQCSKLDSLDNLQKEVTIGENQAKKIAITSGIGNLNPRSLEVFCTDISRDEAKIFLVSEAIDHQDESNSIREGVFWGTLNLQSFEIADLEEILQITGSEFSIAKGTGSVRWIICFQTTEQVGRSSYKRLFVTFYEEEKWSDPDRLFDYCPESPQDTAPYIDVAHDTGELWIAYCSSPNANSYKIKIARGSLGKDDGFRLQYEGIMKTVTLLARQYWVIPISLLTAVLLILLFSRLRFSAKEYVESPDEWSKITLISSLITIIQFMSRIIMKFVSLFG